MTKISELFRETGFTGTEVVPAVRNPDTPSATTVGVPIGAAVAQVEAAADAAQAAAATFTYEIGGFIKKAAGVDEGRYFAAVNLPFDVQLSSIYAQVLTGGGTALVSLVENEVIRIGPLTADATGFTNATSVTLTEGSNVFVQIEGITGSVTEIYIRVVGLPA